MWLLSTRHRPLLAASCLDACVATGMTSRGVVYIDGDEEGLYRGFAAPDNWTVHRAAHGGLSSAMRWCLATYPDEQNYGWLADDMAPRTDGWDVALEQAAGSVYMSQARDCWAFEANPGGVRSGKEPSAGQCWGGDLIRAVGWWALPGTVQAGTDVAWGSLIHRLGRMRFCEDVVVEHKHWRRGKRFRDRLDTDMHDSNGHAHTQDDLKMLYRWLSSRDFRLTVQRVQRKAPIPRGPHGMLRTR